MSPGHARFVTLCQQVLALAAVLAVLTPAASVVSLDVVHREPVSAGTTGSLREMSAQVPTRVVDPVVEQYQLTAPNGARIAAGRLQARVKQAPSTGAQVLLSRPEPVTGFGAVGVTWEHGEALPEAEVGFSVRTRTGGRWSTWTTLAYDSEHGPDPGSAEALRARPGTDPLLVGAVDQVQVRARSEVALPADMKFAVIDPGTATASRTERPAIDTSLLDSETEAPARATAAPDELAVAPQGDGSDGGDGGDDGDGTVALAAAGVTPKPKIFSRAQWGADESMRQRSSLHYGEVHAGFVHHTVNANDYKRSEVPALLRGIYAYHTRARGWSDIGYNFLVDRFGRIWEGRYGGVNRPVVGAHTLNYNDYAFAMSAIGNYETARPSQAVLDAYGALFAWKLSLHGVAADAVNQQVGPSRLPAINGHRDVAATACPGRNLYAKLDTIRADAAADQAGWGGRDRRPDVTSTSDPDLVVRRSSDGELFVIPTGGMTSFAPARKVVEGLGSGDVPVASPDLTGDGHGDVVVVASDGTAHVLAGNGRGGLGDPQATTTVFRGYDQLSAAGDLDEDGKADLIGRSTGSGALAAFLGNGRGGFGRHGLGGDWSTYREITGAGDVDGDGHADVVAVDADGRGWLSRGTGDARLRAAEQIPGDFRAYDVVTGLGDSTGDGRDDLFVRVAKTQRGYVLPSNGDGTYGHRLGKVVRAKGMTGVSGADLAGSAAPDLLGRRGGALVLVRKAARFDTGVPIDTGLRAPGADRVLNVGDWDGDGHGDLVVRNASSGNLSLRLGDGTGHFGPPKTIGTGFGRVQLLTAVGDMTGDGRPDLMGRPQGGSVMLYPGAGAKGLGSGYTAHSAITATRQIGVGRWDGDGAPDSMFRVGRRLVLYPGNGPGGLVTHVTTYSLDVSAYDWLVGVGDADRDGHADVLARARATGYLWLLPGTSTGFGPRRFLAEGLARYDLVG